MNKDNKTIIITDCDQILQNDIQTDIYNIVNQLKNVRSICRTFKLLNNLNEYEYIIESNNLKINYPREYEFEINKFADKYNKYLSKIDFYYQILNYDRMLYTNHRLCNAISKTRYLLNKSYIKDVEKPMNLKDTIELTQEFFDEYDPKITKFMNKVMNKKRVVFSQNDFESGVTYSASEKNDAYVFVYPTYTIADCLTLAHEIIHAYIDENTKTMNDSELANTYINNYFEVHSIFIELVFIKYLKDRKIYEEDLINYTKRYLNVLIDEEEDFYKSEYKDSFKERYVIGYVLAAHFYNQYLVNKEEAKKNIMKFMLEMKEKDKMEMLNNYGLNLDEIQNEKKFKRIIRKYVNRLEK